MKNLHNIKAKLPLIIFAAIALALILWGYSVFKERNSKLQDITENVSDEQLFDEEEGSDDEFDGSADLGDEDGVVEDETDFDVEEDEDENIAEEKTNLVEVYPKDCSNACKNFDDSDEKKYCRQVCGLPSDEDEEDEEKDGCDSLSGLDKDYCLKNLAVSKGDFKICEEIEDLGILKTCRNRITEDILESQD